MSQPSIPLSSASLCLKQIRVDDLNQLGNDALGTAFTGFHEDVGAARVEAYLDDLRSITGVPNQFFDRNRYRRFAGDALLPRGQYYTIASDESGSDGGTLVRELRAYYNPLKAGIVQTFDATDARDRQILSRFNLPGPGLVLVFLPIRHFQNAFSKRFSSSPQPLLVHLPLRVETREVSEIVDLRNPHTAARFAEALNSIEWNLRGAKINAACLRPRLSGFQQIIPALLEQSPGGNSFTNMVGTWLRQNGARGLVFPSARVDSVVDVFGRAVTRSEGFNFVDFGGESAPFHDAFIDLGQTWPEYAQLTPEGPHQDNVPITFAAVSITYQDSGSTEGSWAVSGLRRSCEGSWRALMALAVISQFKGRIADEHLSSVVSWIMSFFMRVFPRQEQADWRHQLPSPKAAEAALDQLGAICMIFQEALMGVSEQIERLSVYMHHIRASNPALAGALEEFLRVANQV